MTFTTKITVSALAIAATSALATPAGAAADRAEAQLREVWPRRRM